jgi:MYXO-CTERM domain-containing protein
MPEDYGTFDYVPDPDAGASADTGTGNVDGEGEDGCGCRVGAPAAGGGRSGLLWLAALLLVALLRGRRR